MSISKIMPKLWLKSFGDDFNCQSQCDCDCACAESLIAWKSKQGISLVMRAMQADTREYIALNQDLHLEQLCENTIALGGRSEGVVVLDAEAATLLSRLKSPMRLSELKPQFSDWSNDIFERTVTMLLTTNILASSQIENCRMGSQDMPEILAAWLHLTNRCNLACAYCYVRSDARQMSITTAQRSVDSVFRSAALHGYTQVKLKYAGGEPTLNFDGLLSAQKRAESLSTQTGIGLETVLLTNGVDIDDAQIEALIAHNIRVMLSLDGLGRYQNTQRFGRNGDKGSFETVAQTLDHLISSGLTPYISITITAQNLAGLPELVEYLLERQLRFGFNFYRAADFASEPAGLALDPNTLIEGLGRAFQAIERRLPRYSLFGALTDRANPQVPHIRTCGLGQNYMVIDCEGNIAQCQMDLAHPVTTIEAADPLGSLQAYTGGIQNLAVDQKECRECIWRYRCAGGCPRLTFQQTGRYDAKSPLCKVYKAILPEVVRLEALRMVRYEEPWDFSILLPFKDQIRQVHKTGR